MESEKSKNKENADSIDEDEEFLQQSRMIETQDQEKTSPWMGVFYRLGVAELLGVILYFSPSFATSWSAMYGIAAENSLTMIFLSMYLASLMLPFNPLLRFDDDETVFHDLYKLLRVVALLLFAVIVGCTAVLNFSLAMIIAVASVPLVTPIRANTTRLRVVHIIMALLASPVVIAVAASLAEHYVFDGAYNSFTTIITDALRSSYEQSLLENSWNYELACLLLYPSWLLFWFIAAAKAPVA